MAEITLSEISLINKFLPNELLKKILKNLDYKTLASAKETCKRWKHIIDGFELIEQALSKFFRFSTVTQTQTVLSIAFISNNDFFVNLH